MENHRDTLGVDNPAPLPVRRTVRELADHVRSWRKLRGLTQDQLAQRAGVTRRTISRIERADQAVGLETWLRVLHALGILGGLAQAIDPFQSDVGRLRADERLPDRVRPRKLGGE